MFIIGLRAELTNKMVLFTNNDRVVSRGWVCAGDKEKKTPLFLSRSKYWRPVFLVFYVLCQVFVDAK